MYVLVGGDLPTLCNRDGLLRLGRYLYLQYTAAHIPADARWPSRHRISSHRTAEQRRGQSQPRRPRHPTYAMHTLYPATAATGCDPSTSREQRAGGRARRQWQLVLYLGSAGKVARRVDVHIVQYRARGAVRASSSPSSPSSRWRGGRGGAPQPVRSGQDSRTHALVDYCAHTGAGRRGGPRPRCVRWVGTEYRWSVVWPFGSFRWVGMGVDDRAMALPSLAPRGTDTWETARARDDDAAAAAALRCRRRRRQERAGAIAHTGRGAHEVMG